MDRAAAWLALALTQPRAALVERMRQNPEPPRWGRLPAPARDAALHVWSRLAACGARVLAFPDPDYPPLLRQLTDPPAILYALGPGSTLADPMVAVIGSRHPTGYGLAAAETLGAELVAEGATVVSGMALGVDCAALRGAQAAGGACCAILGSGIDRPYPATAKPIYDRLRVSGLILTEYPPGTPGYPGNFPVRNRLISGISRAVVVVEAGRKSGTMSTVTHAARQGKEVCAMPGPRDSALSAGPHRLIREGATLVTSGAHVMAAVRRALPGAGGGDGAPVASLAAEDLPADGDTLVVNGLLEAGPATPEALCILSELPLPRVLVALTALELAGRLRRLPDGSFHKSPRERQG